MSRRHEVTGHARCHFVHGDFFARRGGHPALADAGDPPDADREQHEPEAHDPHRHVRHAEQVAIGPAATVVKAHARERPHEDEVDAKSGEDEPTVAEPSPLCHTR
jgi:hypothetical protein